MQSQEYYTLTDFQIKLIEDFQKLKPGDPFMPWKNRTVIQAIGTHTAGWTKDNKLFLISTEGYSITNLEKGEMEIFNKEPERNHTNKFSSDNLEFYINELDEKIKIFGINGGDGNHYTSDGWILEKYSPNLFTNIIGIRKPYHPEKGIALFWDDFQLIALTELKYANLKMSFSPDEKYFMILGNEGAEIFSRI